MAVILYLLLTPSLFTIWLWCLFYNEESISHLLNLGWLGDVSLTSKRSGNDRPVLSLGIRRLCKFLLSHRTLLPPSQWSLTNLLENKRTIQLSQLSQLATLDQHTNKTLNMCQRVLSRTLFYLKADFILWSALLHSMLIYIDIFWRHIYICET